MLVGTVFSQNQAAALMEASACPPLALLLEASACPPLALVFEQTWPAPQQQAEKTEAGQHEEHGVLETPRKAGG